MSKAGPIAGARIDRMIRSIEKETFSDGGIIPIEEISEILKSFAIASKDGDLFSSMRYAIAALPDKIVMVDGELEQEFMDELKKL